MAYFYASFLAFSFVVSWEKINFVSNGGSNEIIEEYVEIMQKLMGYAAAEYVIKTILNSKFTEMITPFL